MKLCIVIAAYKRPDLLKRCLAAVAAIPQVKDGLQVFVSCDGGPLATSQMNMVAVDTSGIPQISLGVAPGHMGMKLGLYSIFAKCFDAGGWDEVLFLPEDDVVSPHIVTVLKALQSWLAKNYTSKHFVGSSHTCELTREQKLSVLGKVGDWGMPLAACIISKACWDALRPTLDRYMPLPIDYTCLGPVGQLYQSLAPSIPPTEPGGFPCSWNPVKHFSNPCATSIDAAFILAARVAGWSYVTTQVNRVIDIGETGENTTAEIWRNAYGKTNLDIFDSDATIAEFEKP